jgi:hypothetical protein
VGIVNVTQISGVVSGNPTMGLPLIHMKKGHILTNKNKNTASNGPNSISVL